jgi:hypothetical protein
MIHLIAPSRHCSLSIKCTDVLRLVRTPNGGDFLKQHKLTSLYDRDTVVCCGVGTESFKNVCDSCYKGWRFVLMLSFCQGLCCQVGCFLFCVSWPNLSDACYMYLMQFWIHLVFQLVRRVWREKASIGTLGFLLCHVISGVACEGAGQFIFTINGKIVHYRLVF